MLINGLKKAGGSNYCSALNSIPRNLRIMYTHAYQSFVWNEMASKRLELFGFNIVPGDLIQTGDSARAVTSDEIAEGKFTIHDVVLPMPGTAVIYPENLREFYLERFQLDGVAESMFRNSVRDYSLRGDYRKIVSKPGDLQWKILHYNDNSIRLSLADLDIIQGKPEPVDVPDGTFKAVLISFNLPSSCYATMCLRELIHYEGNDLE
jgi:tRNA pseudouridine13 synthase